MGYFNIFYNNILNNLKISKIKNIDIDTSTYKLIVFQILCNLVIVWWMNHQKFIQFAKVIIYIFDGSSNNN
jgi:hypothetical protein